MLPDMSMYLGSFELSHWFGGARLFDLAESVRLVVSCPLHSAGTNRAIKSGPHHF